MFKWPFSNLWGGPTKKEPAQPLEGATKMLKDIPDIVACEICGALFKAGSIQEYRYDTIIEYRSSRSNSTIRRYLDSHRGAVCGACQAILETPAAPPTKEKK